MLRWILKLHAVPPDGADSLLGEPMLGDFKSANNRQEKIHLFPESEEERRILASFIGHDYYY